MEDQQPRGMVAICNRLRSFLQGNSRHRVGVALIFLLSAVILVYALLLEKMGDPAYIFAGVVLFICLLSSLLVPLRLAQRARRNQLAYEQVPQNLLQHRGGQDYLFGVNIHHLRLIMREGDFDANDYEELLRLDEGSGINHGLHQTQIEQFPRHVHVAKDGEKESKSKKITCAICLEEIKSGEELRTIPCMHSFHVECIDKWLRSKPNCPVCLFPVLQSATITNGDDLELGDIKR